jgi:hypothetical protein
MNIDQWIRQVSEAYKSAGLELSNSKRSILLSDIKSLEGDTPSKEILSEVSHIMIHFFFKKATHDQTFGPLSRVKERFGKSVEENYGMSQGPFMKMANAYWTYKLEVNDLFPANHNLALSQVLLTVENDIASVFFPTPGPMEIPVSRRREAQRQLLKEFAPEVDIDKFLSENPILRANESKGGGCFGIAILMVVILFIFLAFLYFT